MLNISNGHTEGTLTVLLAGQLGSEHSDTLGVTLRNVHGEFVALGEHGRAPGPQHHDRHIL